MRDASRRLFLIAWLATGAIPCHAAPAVETRSIDTTAFDDCNFHWRRIRDENRAIQPLPRQPRYSPEQVHEIAANLLLFQRANGGWPKDYDFLAILSADQAAALRASRDQRDTSFDNYNLHSQVDYLARAYTAVGSNSWRNACCRGFDFILASQLPCGGFPQRYPGASGYAAQVTFNDGVTIGALQVLSDAATRAPQWEWLDATRRELASNAVATGVDCILECQISHAGDRLGWCQQHDATTFQPIAARTFELAAVCPQETTAIVGFLMKHEPRRDEIDTAIVKAVQWLRAAELHGVRVERVPAPAADFLRHHAEFDVVVRDATDAPTIWARHYEIGTNRPIFAGRDGVKRYSLSEIERERRTGTPWYGEWPRELVAHPYDAWRARRQQVERGCPLPK